MEQQDVKMRQSELASKVMSLTVGKLLLRQHYLSSAVGRLGTQQYKGTLLTDGRRLCYDPSYILERYRQGDSLPVHNLLHSLLHNIFRHWNIGTVAPKLWDLCCDISAEALAGEISTELVPAENAEKRAQVIHSLSLEVRPLTAEKLYSYLSKNPLPEDRLAEYSALFRVDDHRLWHKPEPEPEKEPKGDLPNIFPEIVEGGDKPDAEQQSSGSDEGESDESSDTEQPRQASDEQGSENNSESKPDTEPEPDGSSDGSAEEWLDKQLDSQRSELEKQWREIAKQIQSELEGFGRSDTSARFIDALGRVDRERTDYRSFLRRFAVAGEMMKPDLDAFDVNFYCYGMALYGNVAFIEPPEYKEVRRIKDFVIAIDTSGSVSRETVRIFARKTYNILKSEESFFSRMNIHILQCDSVIEDAAVITCGEELDNYINSMEIKGLGGTDFRPVFDYVDSQRAQGGLKDLRGLIYFTDGLGVFPETPPDYETAFVFVEGDYESEERPAVPPWAVKIVMEEGDVFNA